MHVRFLKPSAVAENCLQGLISVGIGSFFVDKGGNYRYSIQYRDGKYRKRRRKNHAGTQDKSLIHNLLSIPASAACNLRTLVFLLDKKQADTYTDITKQQRKSAEGGEKKLYV